MSERPQEQWARERDCYSRHLRVNTRMDELTRGQQRNRETLILIGGIDGRNGSLGNLREGFRDQEIRLRSIERAVTRGMAIAGVVAAAASAAFSLLLKMI